MKKNLEKQEREACTFKPKILSYKKPEPGSVAHQESQQRQQPPQSENNGKVEGALTERAARKHTKVSTIESTGDRCKLLYELSKKITKKDDKPTDQYKFEKEKDQYTFNPNLKKEEVKLKPGSSGMVDKAVERMKKARAERERVQNALSRGSDDPGMRFGLQKDKYGGSFQQFSNSKEMSLRKSKDSAGKSLMEAAGASGTFDNPTKSMQAPFSTEISPQPTKTLEEDPSQRASAVVPAGPKPAEVEPSAAAAELKGSVQALSEAQSVDQSQQNSGPPLSQPESKEALLFIDVNLGAKQKRIVVYKGDTASELADSFAKENGIQFFKL